MRPIHEGGISVRINAHLLGSGTYGRDLDIGNGPAAGEPGERSRVDVVRRDLSRRRGVSSLSPSSIERSSLSTHSLDLAPCVGRREGSGIAWCVGRLLQFENARDADGGAVRLRCTQYVHKEGSRICRAHVYSQLNVYVRVPVLAAKVKWGRETSSPSLRRRSNSNVASRASADENVGVVARATGAILGCKGVMGAPNRRIGSSAFTRNRSSFVPSTRSRIASRDAGQRRKCGR